MRRADLQRVIDAMAQRAVTGESADSELLGEWVTQLSKAAVLIAPEGDPGQDPRPTALAVSVHLNRELIETACCLTHVFGPLFSEAFTNLVAAMVAARWQLPPVAADHPPLRPM